MSCFYILHDDEGRILASGGASDTSIPYMNAREGERVRIVEALHDANTTWWDGSAVRARTALPPITATGPAPFVLHWPDLPAGTTATVRNEAGQKEVLADFSEPLTLTDPGQYRIRLDTPPSHLPQTFTAEITDA